jgi:hypothetical protein
MAEKAFDAMDDSYRSSSSALLSTARWLRVQWIQVLLCSGAILIPCFWHKHIQACDLGSHLYIAWLTQAVQHGYLPGFHLAHKYTNVLVDLLLSNLFPFFGPSGTERTVVSFCVLTFFWGSFAFASAAGRRPAWPVAPLLAAISYGAIFHWGFFNCYLSIGFSLFALALIVGGNARDFLVIPVLIPLAAMAHPLGGACFFALATFLAGLRWLPAKYRLPFSGALLLVAFGARWYLVRHLEVLPREIDKYWLLGADQMVVFGPSYFWLALLVLILCGTSVLLALRSERSVEVAPWLYFYFAVAIVVATAPGGFNSAKSFGMMGYLPDRMSLYSAIALAALVTACRPGRWFAISAAVVGVLFFAFVYRDTGLLERREAKVEALVCPYAGRRVFSYYPAIPHWRIHEDHSVARACIEHCYDYTNYEPTSMQFRLSADEENHVVAVDQDQLDAMQDGSYIVQDSDLPLLEVYQCGGNVSDLCIAELHEGQKTGDVPSRVTVQ